MRCASNALTGVSLASVETGLAPVSQGSRKCCLAGGGAPGAGGIAGGLEQQAGRYGTTLILLLSQLSG